MRPRYFAQIDIGDLWVVELPEPFEKFQGYIALEEGKLPKGIPIGYNLTEFRSALDGEVIFIPCIGHIPIPNGQIVEVRSHVLYLNKHLWEPGGPIDGMKGMFRTTIGIWTSSL